VKCISTKTTIEAAVRVNPIPAAVIDKRAIFIYGLD